MILVTGATGTHGLGRWCERCWSAARTCACSPAIPTRRATCSAGPSRWRSAISPTPPRCARRSRREHGVPLGRRRSAPGRVGDSARSTRPSQRACAGSSSSRRSSPQPGAPVAFWDWHGRIEEHLRESGVPAVVPALQLLHVERAGRRRAGRARRPAVRARRRGADRDDRPARRRPRRRGGHLGAGARRADLRPDRARGDHLRRGGGRALSGDGPRGRVRRRARRGRAAGHDRGRPARLRRRGRSSTSSRRRGRAPPSG